MPKPPSHLDKLLAVIVPEDDPAKIESFLTSAIALGEIHQRVQLIYQAIQGACLIKLRALFGSPEGGRPSKTAAPCGGFQDHVRQKFGISDDKARRLMAVAQGMAPRLTKLAPRDRETLFDLLHEKPHTLTKGQVELLNDLTHKITDVTTQKAFLEDCGFLKLDTAKPGHGKRPEEIAGRQEISTEDRARVQMELFFQFADSIEEKAELGKETVYLVAHWPDDVLDNAITKAVLALETLRSVKKQRRSR